MTSFLPDISVWVPLVNSAHIHHSAAVTWFESSRDALYFCRISQLGLLRLMCDQRVMGSACRTQRESWQIYDRLTADPRISFAAEPYQTEAFFREFSARNEASSKLFADQYLAAFAIAGGMTLVTFDKALAARVPTSILLTP